MPRFDRLSLWLGAAATLAGAAALLHYLRAGLTLAHYDAKAHLVVARRIFDSVTPTWDQIGAVWLPLPHVLNMLPVQIDGDALPPRPVRAALGGPVVRYCV